MRNGNSALVPEIQPVVQMKRSLLLLFLVGLPMAKADEPFPPTPNPPGRFAELKLRSPFVLPTFIEQQVAVQTDWTSDFRIVSVLQLGEESVVIAKKVSTDERISIRSKENNLGIRLVSVQLSPDPHNVSAAITKGGEQGTITYDDSILSQVPRSAAPNNPAVIAE